MASVRMSEALRDQIKSNARKLFDVSFKKAQNKLAPDFYDRLLEAVYNQEVASLEVVRNTPLSKWPSDWLDSVQGISCHNLEGAEETYTYGIEAETTIEKRVPKLCRTSSWPRSSLVCERLINDSLFQEYDKYNKNIVRIETERQEFVTKVVDILRRCNTLKQFLEAWPQGENLIPKEALTKYYEPVVPREKPADYVPPEVSETLSSTLVKKTIINRGN